MTQVRESARPEFSPRNAWGEAAPRPRAAADNVGAFAAGFFEGAAPALTTVLNRKVAIRVAEIADTTPAGLTASLPFPWVMAECPYQRGLNGNHVLVLAQPEAVALATALFDGEEIEDLGPGHVDAIGEALNQVLAAAGPTLMPFFARSIAFTPVTARLILEAAEVPESLGAPDDRVQAVRAEIAGDGDLAFSIVLTIGADVARQIAAVASAPAPAPAAAEPRRGDEAPSRIDLIMDVTLPVAVELGRARMQIRDILKLAPGSVVELDKSAGDPVEIYINDRAIAKGEVVIIDESFGVRLTSIVTASERIKTLR